MKKKIFASMLAVLLLAGCNGTVYRIKDNRNPLYTVEQTTYDWNFVDDFRTIVEIMPSGLGPITPY